MLIKRYNSPVEAHRVQGILAIACISFRVRISRHKLRGIEYVFIIYPVVA